MRAGRASLDSFETRQNLVKVADAFERLIPAIPNTIVIDASQPVHEIAKNIQNAISPYLA